MPVEVTQFGWELTQSRLAALAQSVTRRTSQDSPYRTDGGNYILDCNFGAIEDATALNRRVQHIVGVVETGLFVGMADLALVAGDDGVTRFTPNQAVPAANPIR